MDLFQWMEHQEGENLQAGMRLHKLEIYNWGTFDKKIWVYAPMGQTTLLTGESGSGKSTLVDALTTLFVSPRKIAYNKAADATAKERTVTSYVQGVYGQKAAYEGKGKPEALRGTNQFSVILGIFRDEKLDKTVTMAIFFWFKEQSASPSRFYLVCSQPLSIADDFSRYYADIKKLRAALKAKGAEIFDDYNHYGERYRKALGGLKYQAVDLFQQTISMKKVEALTAFVRDHMLEETEIDSEIDKLLNHYHDLNSAYEAVLRARRQIEMLEPISRNGQQCMQYQAALTSVQQAQNSLPYWFATWKEGLYVAKIDEWKKRLEDTVAQLIEAQQVQEEIRTQIRRLDLEIYQNGGQTLEHLQTEIVHREEEQSRRVSNYKKYQLQASVAALPMPENQEMFRSNEKRLPILLEQAEQEKKTLEEERTNVSMALNAARTEKRVIEQEMASLQNRTSNIPDTLIQLRKGLCAQLKLTQEQLPFVGELLEVKESEALWEGAIERLMHGFALSLLVTEPLYAAVAKWVEQRSLGTKLVYFRIKQDKTKPEALQLHPHAVCHKINIKKDSTFFPWLTKEVQRRFDHVCCEDLTVFQREKRAITKKGQIKAQMRHEKDDRSDISDRTRYVLGFSNQKKIEALKREADLLHRKIKEIEKQKNALEVSLKKIEDQRFALAMLLDFHEFRSIDIKSVKLEIDAYHKQIEEIKADNGRLKTLQRQREQYERQYQEKKKETEQLQQRQGKLESRLEDLQMGKQKNDNKLLEQQAAKHAFPYLDKNKQQFLGRVEITLENGELLEQKYQKALQEEQRKLADQIAALTRSIERDMAAFCREYPNETKEMDDAIAALNEYETLLDQLNRDGLPRYEAQFHELLKTKVIQQIALFQATLRQYYDNIKTRIEDINQSLFEIDYNTGRYIKLNCEDNPDAEIREFRARLKACTEGALSAFDNGSHGEEKFYQVREMIERFQGRKGESEGDKRWTKKVTNVRNWFLFSASERWRESNEEYEHYTDSGGKSGGQKEKLAYTILAASLVYNYGLNHAYPDQTSFRLVAIDEAFLKSSDDSAKYGLELFKKLDFQLVIVTPLLKISTIEPYISHVGFVSHNDITHQSALMNIGIEEYREKRRAWEEGYHAMLDRQ